jgi:hypothetical protein
VNTAPSGMSPLVRKVKPATVDAARYLVGARLVDSLLHEARNHLNALSINLGILSQKLKASLGDAPNHEKNLKAMREQLVRVDEVMRLFAEFIAPKPLSGEVDFSETTRRAVEVVAHESRQYRVQIRSEISPGIKVVAQGTGLEFLAALPLLRAIARAKGGGHAELNLSGTENSALLVMTDSGAEQPEPFPESLPALEALCQEHSGSLSIRGGELRIELSLR